MSNFDRNAPVWGAGRAQQTSAVEMDQGLRSFMLGVYNNMAIGLGITGLAALAISMLAIAGFTPEGQITGLTALGQAIYLSPLKWVVMLAPLAFIMLFSFKAESMSAASARTMFFVFAAVMGVSMSSILVVFTGASVTRVFFITAAAFGALSLVGYTTKKSLSGMGSFLIMGLIGLIIASVVNLFLGSSALSFGISVLGVLIFAGLTAWDTQRLKEMYLHSDLDPEAAAKLSVNGALSLYLNFINMFQMLISLLGDRR
ncbi:Bax inhibitor-1/YccA family protein [Bosea sp. (in: a-proteobacteria)]|uniref:Bax inhibitor-1/YccA family protein n=1 Tax=Bosea sp. (in: a-proteobacteria) TaxID=1871050 RepID=UPI0026300F4F|nr:Bax inhibitor-1/YccA family protein [Bosea sp. (in: a-proteobacteria)]MCO5090532.1 Bax inhibitor-1/YccA family protein [Bosea sp. (in: a-proteobacteria)]